MSSPDLRGWHSRGYLPHFDAGEVPQAITLRLQGSLPQSLLASWREELASLPTTAARGELRKRVEAALDAGQGACWLGDTRIAAAVQGALLHFDGGRYRLHAWVVMPNHLHVLITPHEDQGVPAIVHSWKSYTAKVANELLARRGVFWQEDYFDRFVRDDQHFAAAVAYIEGNPVRAGLCANAAEWPFSSAAWQRRG